MVRVCVFTICVAQKIKTRQDAQCAEGNVLMAKTPRVTMKWIEGAIKKCPFDGLMSSSQLSYCCGVIEIGNFDDFECEFTSILEDYYQKMPNVSVRFGVRPVQNFFGILSDKSKSKLTQMAFEQRIIDITNMYGSGKMFIATTVQYQAEAACALANTGFKQVGKKLSAYGNTITVWLKQ